MAVSNRAAKLSKLHKVAKKLYQPVRPPADRSVLEHLLYACCLENSDFEAADEAFARLQESYFDWNEVRVTTTVELAEAMKCLSRPQEAAVRLKKTLHSMFETHYQFNIDHLKKENLGKAVQIINKYKGITPFVVGYVSQNGLGGHAIPVDQALIKLMYAVGVIDEKEAEKRQVPGLERAIPKTKGVEFFSLTHQLAVAYFVSPFNNEIRKVLLGIDRTAAERFPKRERKKKKTAKTESVAATPVKPGAKRPAKKTPPAARTAGKKPVKKTASRKPEKKMAGKKKSVAKGSKKKPAAKGGKKKSPTKRLAKKKPR